MVVTVFLLFCTVLSFTWGPKCILCVWIVIYQEFCEILWGVFVLVLLYLVSCIFSTVPSISVSDFSLIYFSVLPFFNSNWLPLLHTVQPERKKGRYYYLPKKLKKCCRIKRIKLFNFSELVVIFREMVVWTPELN